MNERRFRVKTGLGNYIAPKEEMTESEIREFALQLIQDAEEQEIWREKVMNDDINDLFKWINFTNITIEEIES